MVFPDISAEKFLNKYPALKEGFPLCSCEKPTLRPYRTRRSAGIECIDCNTAVWLRIKHKDNQRLIELLTGVGVARQH